MPDPQAMCQPQRLGHVRIQALLPPKPAKLDPVALAQRNSEGIAPVQPRLPASRPKLRNLYPIAAHNRIYRDPAASKHPVQLIRSKISDDMHLDRNR
jgi:hypothetical protein